MLHPVIRLMIPYKEKLQSMPMRPIQALILSLSFVLPASPALTNDPAKERYVKSTLGLYDIATFDVYTDRQNVHIIAGGRQSQNDTALTLRYKRSIDGGHSWTMPVTISAQLPAINAKRGNDVQLAAHGNQIVALMQAKTSLPGIGPMMCLYSEDSGLTWKYGANPAEDNDGSQAHIDLVADKAGIFHAVWLEDPEENGYQSLRYSRSEDGGKSWNQLKTIDDSTCSCCWNTIVNSPLNHLNVLYRNMSPRDMAMVQSTDQGVTWQQLGAVGDFKWQLNGCPHVGGGASYVTGGATHWLHGLVWTGIQEKAGLYHLVSSDHGSTWSEPLRLSVTGMNGDIAHHGRHLVAAWNEMNPSGMSISLATITENGTTWNKPIQLTPGENAATQPRLTATASGVLVVWTEKPAKQTSQLAWKLIKPEKYATPLKENPPH